MDCPVCKGKMTEEDFGGVKVDVCKEGCKGIWFDWFELSKLDEKNEGFGRALKEALAYPRVNDANRGQIPCPKCGLSMHTHIYRSAKEINIDECYRCGGFFLDSGELQAIRDNFMSEEEQTAYTDKMLNNIPDYKQAKKDLKKNKVRAEAIRKYTKYIRLSYYMTGK